MKKAFVNKKTILAGTAALVLLSATYGPGASLKSSAAAASQRQTRQLRTNTGYFGTCCTKAC